VKDLDDFIGTASPSRFDNVPRIQQVRSSLQAARATVAGGLALPNNVRLVFTYFGGRSTGITAPLIALGVTSRNLITPPTPSTPPGGLALTPPLGTPPAQKTPTPCPGVPGAAQAGGTPEAAVKGSATPPTATQDAVESPAPKSPSVRVTGGFQGRVRSGLRTAGVSAASVGLGVAAALIRAWGAERHLKRKIKKLEPEINTRLAARRGRIAEIQATGAQPHANITFTASVIQNMGTASAAEAGPSLPFVDPKSLWVDVSAKNIQMPPQTEAKSGSLNTEEITTYSSSSPIEVASEETP
jgi:hypothetical protein